jgi:hypothetical protein
MEDMKLKDAQRLALPPIMVRAVKFLLEQQLDHGRSLSIALPFCRPKFAYPKKSVNLQTSQPLRLIKPKV